MVFIVGYIFALINLFVVIRLTTDRFSMFLDFHAFLIVFIGTFCVALIAFQIAGLKRFVQIIKIAVIRKDDDLDLTINEVIGIARQSRGDMTSEIAAGVRSQNHFLGDGISLIADGFTKEEVSKILTERIRATVNRYRNDEKILRSLVKVPPSFGLVGTTIGLIVLFAQVGSADAMKTIGPAMAVAMTATFYGLIFAFLIISPLVERIVWINSRDLQMREMTKQGVLLLMDNSSPIYIEEILKSYLNFAKQQQRKGGRK